MTRAPCNSTSWKLKTVSISPQSFQSQGVDGINEYRYLNFSMKVLSGDGHLHSGHVYTLQESCPHSVVIDELKQDC